MSWKSLAYNKAVPEPTAQAMPIPMMTEVAPKDVPETVVGRLQKILEYLNSIGGHKAVSVAQIYQKTGIDLSAPGEYEVAERVRNNTKVRTEGDLFAYKAKFDIKNREDLQRQLNRSPEGIPMRDLKDCYHGVEDDLAHLTHLGVIICIRNAEDSSNEVYYPRGESFLTELSGYAAVEPGSYIIATKEDLTGEVRRGDSIRVGDHWFRVSAAPKTGGGGQHPTIMSGMTNSKSVSSVRDLNLSVTKKTRYMLNFDSNILPLDSNYPDHRVGGLVHQKWDSIPKVGRGPTVKLVKHGCTNDIRQLWKDTLRDWPSDRVALERKLLQCGLMTRDMHEANMNRSKMRKVHGKGNKKVARQRKQRDIKITNTHLVGTALGEALAKGGNDGFNLGGVKFEKE